MALIKCPECKNDVSDSAYSCPHCGYKIKTHIKKQKIEQELEEKKQLIEKQKLIVEDNRKEAKKKIKAFYKKYLNTKKQKLIAIITPSLIICIAISSAIAYSIIKSDYIEIKRNSIEAVEKIEYIDKNIYEYNEFQGTKLYKVVFWDFQSANNLIGSIRECYSNLSNSDKESLDSYLQRTCQMNWFELDQKYKSYGLIANSASEASNFDDEYYKNLINEKREEYEESIGDVKVTSKSSNHINDKFIINGTVKNTTQSKVTFVEVKVVLMNDKLETLNTASTYAVGDEGLLSGESTTFSCYIDDVDGVTKYKAYVYDYEVD